MDPADLDRSGCTEDLEFIGVRTTFHNINDFHAADLVMMMQPQVLLAERDSIIHHQSRMIDDLAHQLSDLQGFTHNLQNNMQAQLKQLREQHIQLQYIQRENKALKDPESVRPRQKNTATTPLSNTEALVPVTALGNLTPHQKRPFQMTPHPADDVFAQPPESPTPGPRALRQTDFEKKQLPELLASCFIKVEATLRKVPLLNIITPGPLSFDAEQIVKLLNEHIGNNRKLVFTMLKDENERYWTMIALISHTIVDYIFKDHIIGNVPSNFSNAYTAVFEEEAAASEHGHPKIDDLVYRHSLADQRAHWARNIVELPGFWKWVQQFTTQMTEKIVHDLSVCFPKPLHGFIRYELFKAINEAMRISIRLKQEPKIYEYIFPTLGTPWNSTFHVHRNPALRGQILGDEKSPWCVRIAATPVVKEREFQESGPMKDGILHRAEVIVGDRKTHLRAARNRR